MIKVVSMRGGNRHVVGSRIDRGTVLGNPFVIGRDGNRAEVIAKYETWIRERLNEKDPEICRAMNRLYRNWKTRGELKLKCWITATVLLLSCRVSLSSLGLLMMSLVPVIPATS